MTSPDNSLRDPLTPSRERLEATINEINNKGWLVVGSVGRAAVFGKLAGNPNLEFERRGEDPLVSAAITPAHISLPRDVDFVGGRLPDRTIASLKGHKPDSGAFLGHRFRIIKDADGWRGETGPTAMPSVRRFDPEIFEPFEGRTIEDIVCRTVRPATHFLLFDRSKTQRPNDELATELLKKYMPPEEDALLNTPMFRGFAVFMAHCRLA